MQIATAILMGFFISPPERELDFKHPVTAQIQAVTGMSLSEANDWMYSVTNLADEVGMDPKIIVAIIRQESTFRTNAKNCYAQGVKRICDSGAMQINEQWVRRWGLDRKQLFDRDYNLEVAGRILKDLKARYGHEKHWYTRFHSPTPKFRAIYLGHLNKWLGRMGG